MGWPRNLRLGSCLCRPGGVSLPGGAFVSIRLAVLVAAVIITWAAVIAVTSSVHPLNKTHLVAATVVVLAVAIQRLSAVQAWLAKPRQVRKEGVEALAQQTLINLSMDRPVTRELMDLRIHVWEVPLWYRRLFPYSFRNFLRNMRRDSRDAITWTLRPTFNRTAALGLLKQAPSGVNFRKGNGIIGVCVANNDHGEYLALNVSSDTYRRALDSDTEEQWRAYGKEVTHNLSLTEAKRLSHSYGQVIAKVVQDSVTGEAIGCVTVSVKSSNPSAFDLKTDFFLNSLTDLALGVAPLLM
jgi:hypothetical protein